MPSAENVEPLQFCSARPSRVRADGERLWIEPMQCDRAACRQLAACRLHGTLRLNSCDASRFPPRLAAELTRCSADRPESMRIHPQTTISQASHANAAEGARIAMLL